MKKTVFLIILFLFYTTSLFCGNFRITGIIINESDINIYCTAQIKKNVKGLLNPMLLAIKDEIFWGGENIPFYWNDSYVVDITDVAIWEYTKKIIPNTFINSSWERRLLLFDTSPVTIFDFSGDNTSYHIKTSQYLNYFFSELVLYDENGNTLLTLDDLYGYYEGVNDPEIVTNLWTWDAHDYLIIITQEMIDSCRKKYEKKDE